MQTTEDTYLGQIAQRYARLAREARIAVVSYFCRLSYDEPPRNRTRETIELIALVYSMIRQLIELLPRQLHMCQVDLSSERFNKLDGTLRTWDEALKLLGDLLALLEEPMLVVVIDGLQCLDDHKEMSTELQLKQLVELMQCATNTVGKGCILKVMFTTSGNSVALDAVLDSGSVFRSSPPRARIPGQSIRGMVPIPFTM